MAYRVIRIQLLLTISANCLLQGRDYRTGIYCSQSDDLIPLPLRLTGPFIVYMLRDIDILEDWTAIKKVKKTSCCVSILAPKFRKPAKYIIVTLSPCPFQAKAALTPLKKKGESKDISTCLHIQTPYCFVVFFLCHSLSFRAVMKGASC